MAGKAPTFTSPVPCSHLAKYRRRHGVRGYRSLQSSLRTSPNGKVGVLRDVSQMPRCSSCSAGHGRLYFCLVCSKVFCFAAAAGAANHAVSHCQSEKDHEIAVDVERAELFCCACRDQVYDPDFDMAVMRKQVSLLPKNGAVEFRRERSRRKRKLVLECRAAAAMDVLCVKAAGVESSCFPLGLRGLNNLGNTCFMNSVLQVLLHTPLLRNYFLSGRHDRESCRRGPTTCLCCDIAAIFAAAFSGDRAPFSPARFLYSWWQHAANLASYEQQDAHEFFISMLDRIHEKEKQSMPHDKGTGDCSCIAHKVFSGVLRSDVTCTVCGFTSTKFDPCVDISLHLEPSSSSTHKSTKAGKDNEMSTLIGCLDHFTRPEKLGSDQKLYCQNCQMKQNSLKQMSIRRLPLVLCFHIKRFEHSSIRKMSRKVDQYLQFPFSLDMTPYLSSSIIRNRFGNRIFAFEGDDSDLSTELSTEFELFAVVTHAGKLESGHYVTYLRLREQWYKCDDAWITQVSDRVVRALQGYMMCYVQKMLYYRASDDIAGIPMSPHGLGQSGRESFVQRAACC